MQLDRSCLLDLLPQGLRRSLVTGLELARASLTPRLANESAAQSLPSQLHGSGFGWMRGPGGWSGWAGLVGLVACIAWLGCIPGACVAASPTLGSVSPRLVQRGAETDVVFKGERLDDAQDVLFYEPGITVVSRKAKDPKQFKARLRIAPDARLGGHVVRVRTAGGVTEARLLSVGAWPTHEEKEPNNDLASPQRIEVNTTVLGVAASEDVDYYVVQGRKGRRITAEVEAMRLGAALVDCHLSVLDQRRFEVAAQDDSPLALQDPAVSFIPSEDGPYVIAVRESSFAGTDRSRYALHVTEGPRPRVAWPPGGKAGETLDVRFLGDPTGDIERAVTLPASGTGEFLFWPEDRGQPAPTPHRLRVAPFADVMESEPNDTAPKATAHAGDLPVAFTGVISKPGDVDYFRFKARKDQKFDVHGLARAVQSPLDPVVAIRDLDGKKLTENDDSGGPDARIEWTAPRDGEFLVSVRDHLRGGSPLHVYRVEFRPVAREVVLALPEFVRNSQERNTVSVPRGGRAATRVRVTRRGVTGDLRIEAPGLPAGVRMTAAPVTKGAGEAVLVFEAADDAPMGAALVPLTAHEGTNAAPVGRFEQVLELVQGPPNNTVYFQATVDRLVVAVTEPAPFAVSVAPVPVPMVRAGIMNLRAHVERQGSFKGPVKLRMMWNPPGVGAQDEVTVPEGQSDVVYPLNATGDAALRSWTVALLAEGDAGKGKVWASSGPIVFEVAEPYLSMRIPMAAGETGRPVAIPCKLEQRLPFDGEATVLLAGLPPKVTVEKNPLVITRDAKEVVFHAVVASDAPVGQHKGLFCQVTVPGKGGPIVHSVGGGGVLRIDAPARGSAGTLAGATAAPPAPKAAGTNVPAARSLSRLEKLRAESAGAGKDAP